MGAADTECTFREIRFARMIVEDELTRVQCYRRAGFKAATDHAASNACAMLQRRPRVAKFIAELRQGLHRRARMSLEKQLSIYEDVIHTPVEELDESNPIVQEVTYKPDGTKTLKVMDKHKAMEMHARLTGTLKNTVTIEASEATISLLRTGPVIDE